MSNWREFIFSQEPSLFAVAKLLETGLVNLPRIEVLWRPLTNHLLEVCQHPHIRMREWGVEAITYLVKAALAFKYQQPLKDNMVIGTYCTLQLGKSMKFFIYSFHRHCKHFCWTLWQSCRQYHMVTFANDSSNVCFKYWTVLEKPFHMAGLLFWGSLELFMTIMGKLKVFSFCI